MTKKKKIDESTDEQKLEKDEDQLKTDVSLDDSEEMKSDEKENKKYEQILAQSQEYFEGWQRERADFQNYKKRIERDQISLKSFITAEIIKKYLVIIDDLELALKNRPSSTDCLGWVDGIGLIYQKLISILEGEGVELIPVEGEFDPNIHEAISQIEHPEIESGKIVEVMRQGYKISERVIRPALVIIAR
ncbi:MAG: nucleotide exchange factor GrpE [Chloroflexi bacterium HGW-Chloroflexi-3]|nr:MAG: nucleotide exchange factor GrpE [Chloroflexi bacterium HGW-Chloroflexi-3]